jgi:hypothetical protein
MSGRNAVQQAFDRFGQDAGFEKKSGSWSRAGDEVISISNLQKSQYGPQYFFNQGFWLRELDDERYPKSNLEFPRFGGQGDPTRFGGAATRATVARGRQAGRGSGPSCSPHHGCPAGAAGEGGTAVALGARAVLAERA